MPGNEPFFDLDHLLNPDEQDRYRQLCIASSPEEIIGLREVIELHMGQIEQHSETADTELAYKVAGALSALVQSAAELDSDQRAMVRGAVEYFLLADDASGDLTSPMGLDDDARVVNSVLRRLDRGDLLIDLV